jgi:hypothetical protein
VPFPFDALHSMQKIRFGERASQGLRVWLALCGMQQERHRKAMRNQYRAKRREDLLLYCAEAWAKGERKYCQDRLAWVLEQVNKRLAYGAHIKRNFITRHLAEIRVRAERITNAKRKG